MLSVGADPQGWFDQGMRALFYGRRGVAVLAAGVALLSSGPAVAATARPATAGTAAVAAAGPGVNVSGGELANAGSGTLLWSQGLNTRRPMASITKVMAALVVLRAGDLDRPIRVTPSAVGYARRNDASSAGLIAGDVLTARQLLNAMLLPSGADAAYLLAGTYGPGGPAFIAKMNALAASIGMRSTHFTSFDGLPLPTETSTYSTPADLIRLGERVMTRPGFAQIVAQKSYLLPAGPGHHRYLWKQTNELIGTYAGALGIKTGYTHGAGTCLLFEARRDHRTLIGVVLHASTTYTPAVAAADATRLLNWGFSQG